MHGFSLGKFFRQASGAAARYPEGASWIDNHISCSYTASDLKVLKMQQITSMTCSSRWSGSQKQRWGEKGGEDRHEQRGGEEGCKERGREEGEEGEGKMKQNPITNTEVYWSPTANIEVSFFMFISTRTALPFPLTLGKKRAHHLKSFGGFLDPTGRYCPVGAVAYSQPLDRRVNGGNGGILALPNRGHPNGTSNGTPNRTTCPTICLLLRCKWSSWETW